MPSATPCERPPSAGSISSAIAGSPRKPMPSEVIVMPSWHPDRYSEISSISATATWAPGSVPAVSASSARLARTSANSAATKKPLRRMRTRTARSRSAVIEAAPGPAARRARYFGKTGRRSSGDAASVPRTGDGRRGDSGEPVEPRGEPVVRLGDAALRTGGERQADLVPPVHEDVRVVVRRLGGLGHAVHERNRLGEARELQVADELAVLLAPVLVELRRILGHVRIVSLVPSATETLFALGLGSEVIGVTHECDFPPEAAELPHVTRDVLPPGLTAAEIDAAVEERTARGESIYELDRELLAELEPDLIVTQGLCAVCAVSFEDVRAIAETIPTAPKVISLDPSTLGEVLGDVRTLAEATDRGDAGVALVRNAADRLDRVRLGVRRLLERPRVAALEWLDPVWVGGHWVPQ